MLILSRQSGGAITIRTPAGEVITVAILTIDGGKAKVGIDAPKDFSITRTDVSPQVAPAGARS